ncbi:MAG: hypothetical protein GXP62_14245 [Oligoflexia bacterium]|nr:hypothetical protein [Oligoflexia bacterium]
MSQTPILRARTWPVVGAMLIIGVGVGYGAFAAGFIKNTRPVSQPYPFNHVAHAAAGCSTCHHGVKKQAHAGLPTLNACHDCHATAPGTPDTQAKEMWDAAAGDDLVSFNRLTEVPQHVFFSHRRHVTLGAQKCTTCHGEIASTETPPRLPERTVVMHDCIACHEDNGVAVDCTACHK